METQTELNKEVGTIEPEKKEALEPKKVKIVAVGLRDTKKGKILNCVVKHPDKEEKKKNLRFYFNLQENTKRK